MRISEQGEIFFLRCEISEYGAKNKILAAESSDCLVHVVKENIIYVKIFKLIQF